ncbi:hypothetical protein PHLGIDRAFT_36387 [Phlebiopsis gigantea 11061_1 CR5-6]|uniref:F-box domain-containing protein n=1 Tax=Phlebiopsis gigantea (strain 11061_1 CR5-6) TaxID=745531 RepID=A0A0C3NKM3_PHLG1|nr:hypothetical protein PHLGIDRAFT_36387 [Phlebiopsis gigantea 11061_1 CR5-6]
MTVGLVTPLVVLLPSVLSKFQQPINVLKDNFEVTRTVWLAYAALAAPQVVVSYAYVIIILMAYPSLSRSQTLLSSRACGAPNCLTRLRVRVRHRHKLSVPLLKATWTTIRVHGWYERHHVLKKEIKASRRQNVLRARELNNLTLLPGYIPQEVLSEIIRIYVADWKARYVPEEPFGFRDQPDLRDKWLWPFQEYGWLVITHVCHALRVAAQSDSTLWTDISLISHESTARMLRHAGPVLPLSVAVRKNTDSASLRQIAPLLPRIRTLDLRVNRAQLDRFAKHARKRNFTNLQSLALVACSSWTRDVITPVHSRFDAAAPHLRHLLMGNIQAGAMRVLLRPHPQLKCLTMRMQKSIISIETFVGLLKLVPELETLILDGDFIRSAYYDSEHIGQFLKRIRVQNVKILELHCLHEHHSWFMAEDVVRTAIRAYGTGICIHGLQDNVPVRSLLNSSDEPYRGLSLYFKGSDRSLTLDFLSLCLGPLASETMTSTLPPLGRQAIRFHNYLPWESLLANALSLEQLCVVGSIAYLAPHFLSGKRPPLSQNSPGPIQQDYTRVAPEEALPKLRVLRIERSEFGPCQGVGFKALVEALALRARNLMGVGTLVVNETANLGDIEAGMLREHVGSLAWDRCSRWLRPCRPFPEHDDYFEENEPYLKVKSDDDNVDGGCSDGSEKDDDEETTSSSDNDEYDTDYEGSSAV